jgi:hypothetical protein
MDIIAAYREAGTFRGAAEIAGTTHKTVKRVIARHGEQVVITCRTEQYQAMVSPQDGQGASLRAAAVQLGTLQFSEVTSYLV